MNRWLPLTLFVLFVGLWLFADYNATLRHELGHEAINEIAGCAQTNIDMRFGWQGFYATAECTQPEHVSADGYSAAMQANMFNEAVGYSAFMIMQALFLCTAFISVVLIVTRSRA